MIVLTVPSNTILKPLQNNNRGSEPNLLRRLNSEARM